MQRPLILLALTLTLPFFSFAEFSHKLGVGYHYWTVLDEIDVDDIEESGNATVLAYQLDGGLLAIQAEVEVYPEEFGGSAERVYAPQLVALVGDSLYGGVGVGRYYADGDFAEDPYFLVRAGITLGLFGPIELDLNANYTFADFSEFNEEDINTDTVTIGAMVRVQL